MFAVSVKFVEKRLCYKIKVKIHIKLNTRRIFGPKRNEVKGEWRKFHNEELCDLYCSVLPYIISLHFD
jgi:hypothetical protein